MYTGTSREPSTSRRAVIEDYLEDERIEDVLVGYSIPPKAEDRLRKLQQALHHVRKGSIEAGDLPVLEGILLYGSFVRGKPEPSDIDFVPFFDFETFVKRDPRTDIVNMYAQTEELIRRFERAYMNLGGIPCLERNSFIEGVYPKCYIDCTSDDKFFLGDYIAFARYYRDIKYPKATFNPQVNHLLGPESLKEQFRRVTARIKTPKRRSIPLAHLTQSSV